MKQSSIYYFASNGSLDTCTKIVDLFCGIGGFSCGAKQAGHQIVLAVDSDPFLLGCHIRNNPNCEHVCCKLPGELPLPCTGKWHLHGSPPCTKLSIMQPMQEKEVREDAVDMVAWYLKLALTAGCSSWTMEQVNHKAVRSQLESLKRRYPLKVDWVVVDAVDYEVPQHRRRVVAGSPFLIANLRSFKSKKRKLCVRDVFPNPPRDYLRNSLYNRPDPVTKESVPVDMKDRIRSVDRPSFTVLSSGHLKWADAEGTVLRHLKGSEKALIQTFPGDYLLPWSMINRLIGVGNAVPPRLAHILMTPTNIYKYTD